MDDKKFAAILDRGRADFVAFCRRAGLPLPEGPIDRYGSYVFETGTVVDGLNRYIALALTPDDDGKRIHIEAQAAADDGLRYWVRTFKDKTFVGDLLARLGPEPYAMLVNLWEAHALRVRPEDLAEEYVVPRPFSR
jgi:hypothetical protein